MKLKVAFILACLYIFLFFADFSCTCSKREQKMSEQELVDSVISPIDTVRLFTMEDIRIEKSLLYDKYTLDDVYPYKDTSRLFQWDPIKMRLAFLENMQDATARWAVLQNYKNKNQSASLVQTFVKNRYGGVADTFGVERYQSAPLYLPSDSLVPVRYGRDGWLVKLLSSDTLDFVRVQGLSFDSIWHVPRRYVKPLSDSILFEKVVFVDVTNQNMATLEKCDSLWLVRSMSHVTTGREKPPYARKTPTGLFLLQEQKKRMEYMQDGTMERGGFAPYACRFTNGGYIHGVPTVDPGKYIIEYSSSLGTTPRSHMCVRTASSHAQFIYDWVAVEKTLVFVLE